MDMIKHCEEETEVLPDRTLLNISRKKINIKHLIEQQKLERKKKCKGSNNNKFVLPS